MVKLLFHKRAHSCITTPEPGRSAPSAHPSGAPPRSVRPRPGTPRRIFRTAAPTHPATAAQSRAPSPRGPGNRSPSPFPAKTPIRPEPLKRPRPTSGGSLHPRAVPAPPRAVQVWAQLPSDRGRAPTLLLGRALPSRPRIRRRYLPRVLHRYLPGPIAIAYRGSREHLPGVPTSSFLPPARVGCAARSTLRCNDPSVFSAPVSLFLPLKQL